MYYISKKMNMKCLPKEIGEMFIQMEEQNVLSDTAVYISTDILIHICLYMSELGVDFFFSCGKRTETINRIAE